MDSAHNSMKSVVETEIMVCEKCYSPKSHVSFKPEYDIQNSQFSLLWMSDLMCLYLILGLHQLTMGNFIDFLERMHI